MTDYFYADPHFSHKGVTNFLKEDGSKLRPWTDYETMDTALVELFNDTVTEKDKCYILGDVAINRRGLNILEQLRCENLILIKGNHDVFRLNEYTKYFRDIRAYHVTKGIIFSHIPVHEMQLDNRFGVNVHGHLHSGRVMNGNSIDLRYHCISCEHTEFKPISYEALVNKIIAEGGTIPDIYGN
jgi:calcineurin-like phosphoesterase family protein